MKKTVIVFTLIVFSILLISCNANQKNELIIFLKDLTKENISNYIEQEDGQYNVYLSSDSPILYNTFSDQKKHVVIVRVERSFSYFENEVELQDAKQKKYIYYFDKREKKLYFIEDDDFSLVTYLNKDELYSIVQKIHTELGEEGDILTFDSFYPIIKQFYNDVNKKNLELHGKTSIILSTNYKNNDFLRNSTEFLNHLKKIYNENISLKIIDSIQNNKINSITIRLYYNDDKTISPRIKIFYNYKVYYVIDPLDENYNIDGLY